MSSPAPGLPADVPGLGWWLDLLAVVGAGAAGGLYLAGVRRLAARGQTSAAGRSLARPPGPTGARPGEPSAVAWPPAAWPPGPTAAWPPRPTAAWPPGRTVAWPPGRTVAFAAGLFVVVAAVQPPLAVDDKESFTVHVVQHVLLGMLAPLLFASGAPVTLALQAAGRPARRTLLRFLHSRAVAALTHPATGWGLFGGSLFALYFTPLFELSLRHELVHALVHLHFVVAGSLFLWPLVGVDPLRRRLPHGARVLVVLLAVPFHAVLGLALSTGDDLLAGGWYAAPQGSAASALADQRAGGGLLWATGDLLGLVVTGVVLAQWVSHDRREARRLDRRLDAAVVTPEPGMGG